MRFYHSTVKRIVTVILTLVLLSSLYILPAHAAGGFEISNGVLTRYSGSDTDVKIPDTVKAIGASAFEGNTKVRSVDLPACVTTVGDRAFYGCSSLSTVTGGANVSLTGEFSFRGTPYLESSKIKYLMLGRVLLWYNGASESVSLPTACEAIAPYAFLKCGYLTSVTAYDGLLSVGTGAFYGCNKLSSVNLPSSVSYVGGYAFDGTPYLSAQGAFPTVGDSVLIKYMGKDTQVVVPDGIRRISSRCFTSSKITSVTLPLSVYSVDPYAFADCTGLKEINMDEDSALVNIGDGSFSGCKSLSGLKTPASLKYIGQYAFNGDSALRGVSLCGDDLSVSYNAFKDCSALDYVLLSDGVGSMYSDAFKGCTSLNGISIPSDTAVSSGSLNGCSKVTVSCEKDSDASKTLTSHTINNLRGDVDEDELVTVMDATSIQCYIAHLTTYNGEEVALADLDFDAAITIMDAYQVLMIAAHLI